MPTYEFACEACNTVTEVVCAFAALPASVTCDCGSPAQRRFTVPNAVVRGAARPIKLDGTCVPVGWQYGNRDPEAQERRYAEIIRKERQAAIANDKRAIKQGLRKIATVPRELYRLRSNQYGKDYLDPSCQDTASIKQKLREDDMLFKD